MSRKFKRIKHQFKDRVFQDLFSTPQNQLNLYKSIHPEDEYTSKEDIELITIKPIFVDDIYNDLGLLVNGSLMMFVEAQSTWSVNILPRLLIYVAETLRKYIEEQGFDAYSSGMINIPRIELYVVYTGEKTNIPNILKLSDIFYNGEVQGVEIVANIIYDNGKKDLLSQYITFCKILNEQMHQEHSIKSALKGIDDCINGDILSEYLKSKRMEVAKLMNAMYTRKEYDELRINNSFKEGKAEGKADMLNTYMINHNVPIEDAFKEFNIPESEWNMYRNLIKKM